MNCLFLSTNSGDNLGEEEDVTTLLFDGDNYELGPELPSPAENHCMARLSPDRIVLTGGNDLFNRFWIMDSGMKLVQNITLPQDRVKHACGMAKDPTTGKKILPRLLIIFTSVSTTRGQGIVRVVVLVLLTFSFFERLLKNEADSPSKTDKFEQV